MHEFGSYLQKSFLLVRKHWQIYFVTILFSSYALLESVLKTPSLFNILFSLISLGWLGAKFEFIKSAYEKDSLPWNQFGNLLLKYIKRLLPIAIIIVLINALLVILFFIAYGAWYFQGEALSTDKQILTQQITGLFSSLKETGSKSFFNQQFQVLDVILKIVFWFFFLIETSVLSIMAVENKKVWASVKKSVSFIRSQSQFFIALLITHIALGFIKGRIILFLSGGVLEQIMLSSFIVGIFFKFVDLVLIGSVLILYKTKSHALTA